MPLLKVSCWKGQFIINTLMLSQNLLSFRFSFFLTTLTTQLDGISSFLSFLFKDFFHHC